MSEEAEEAPEEPVAEEGDAAEEEPEEPPEDPEVTALKESIAELESTLADKKSKLQYELEKCEEYSKSGYARKVADMENMKRVRSVSGVPIAETNAFASIVVDLENPEWFRYWNWKRDTHWLPILLTLFFLFEFLITTHTISIQL